MKFKTLKKKLFLNLSIKMQTHTRRIMDRIFMFCPQLRACGLEITFNDSNNYTISARANQTGRNIDILICQRLPNRQGYFTRLNEN